MNNQDLHLINGELHQTIGSADQARWPLVDSDRAKPQEQRLGGKFNLTRERRHTDALNAPKYLFYFLPTHSEPFVIDIYASYSANQATLHPHMPR